MALLKSVENVPGIDFYEYRDSEFYNKYIYRARFKLDGIRFTWFAKTSDELRDRVSGKKKAYYSINEKELPIIQENLETLCNFIEWRNERKKDKKATVRIEYKTAAIFSNDLTLLQDIKNIGPDLEIDYTEVQTAQYAGVKHFVNEPKHKFRIYLKSKRIHNDSTFIRDFNDLMERSEHLHPSPALNIWLKSAISDKNYNYWRYAFTSSSHFIDYDDESTLSYLALMYDGMLGKKYKLEKRPDTN